MKRYLSPSLAALFVCVTSLAHADDVFNACARDTTQKVRASSILVGAVPICRSTETPRTWNQTGPAGPTGPQGPAGPSSASSTSKEIGDTGLPISVPPSGVTVGSLSLPAGSYVAMASLYFTNNTGASGIAYCTLLFTDTNGPGANAQVIDSEANGQAVSQALTVAAQLSSAGTVTLQCRNNNGLDGGNLAIQTFNLNAIQVGTLTVQ